MTEVKYFR